MIDTAFVEYKFYDRNMKLLYVHKESGSSFFSYPPKLGLIGGLNYIVPVFHDKPVGKIKRQRITPR